MSWRLRRLSSGPGRRRRGPRAAVLAYLGLALVSAPAQTVPDWWEVELTVKADGQYRLEAGAAGASGRFAFAIRWTGGLERDDSDYLLYAFDSKLQSWEAGEAAVSPEAQRVLGTGDFQKKPELRLKYILRDGPELCLNFITEGFDVPLSDFEEVFALLLPSSEENDQRGPQGPYNPGVTSGSNRVALREAEIYAGPVTRSYRWSWRRRQWLPRDRGTITTSQSHEARVELRITPRFHPPA
jgi:hypothetical protein